MTLDALDAIATTRAIRRYRPDPIPEDDLAAILWHATRAPSGSNRQPTRYVVLRDGPAATEAKALLGAAFRQAAGAPSGGTHGFDRGSGADPVVAQGPGGPGDAGLRRPLRAHAGGGAAVHRALAGRRTSPRAPRCTRRARTCCWPPGRSATAACCRCGTRWSRTTCDGCSRIPDEAVIAGTITLGVPEGRHGPVRRLPLGDVVYDDTWGGDAPWAVDPPDTRFTGAGPSREA